MSSVRQIVFGIVLLISLLGYLVHQILLVTGGAVGAYGDGVIGLGRWVGWLILIAGIVFTFWREEPEEEALDR